MNVNRTTIFAALLAAGIATGAIAQSTSPGTTSSGKASATAGSQGASTAPAPPSSGSTGMDKGAGTGATTSGTATSTAKGGAAASSLARSERRFIEKALQDNMEEVELSKLAMDKAQNPQVKEFAKRLVDDHTKANAELTKLASAKGVTPPAAVDSGHKRKMERMAKKSGKDFDREYMDDMVDDHQKDVREFRSMSKSAKDADVKAFATSTLPTLEQHLQMAKTTESAVKNAGRERKTTTASSTGSTTGSAPSSTAKSTATPGKDTATTSTAAPASSPPSSASAPPASGSASDSKTTSPTK